MHDRIILLRGDAEAHNARLNPQLFIEVVCTMPEKSCRRLVAIDFVSVFSILRPDFGIVRTVQYFVLFVCFLHSIITDVKEIVLIDFI